MDEQTKAYLLSLLPKEDAWVEELQDKAEENRVPIMDPLGMRYLMQVVRLKKPGRILEVGAAIGYSALRMLEAAPQSDIVTIERDETRYQEAVGHVKQQEKTGQIELVLADALEYMEELIARNAKFDLVFIDAAKGQYMKFFELADKLLSAGGVIVTDNVLFRSYVAGSLEIPKKYKKMVEKLASYNDVVMNHPDYDTTIMPIGDGVAVSVKRF